MITLFEFMFNTMFWIMFMGVCFICYAYGMGVVMYAKAMHEVLEERKHQRQIELLEMTLALERSSHGQVSHRIGLDCGRIIDCSLVGEGSDAILQGTSEGAVGQDITALVEYRRIQGP